MALNLPFGIKPVNPSSNVDERYGEHLTIQDALDATEGTRAIGLTVLVSGVEYWFKEGILDQDLIPKNPDLIIDNVNLLREELDSKTNISDIIDTLTSLEVSKPLSANQGKVLKDFIDQILLTLSSDDSNLDTLQEVVNLVKQIESDVLTKANLNGDITEVFKVSDPIADEDAVNLQTLNTRLGEVEIQVSDDFYIDENGLLQSNEAELSHRFVSPDDATQDVVVPFEITQVLSIHVGNTHLDNIEYNIVLPSTINFKGNLEKGDFVEILYKTRIQ
jgi:hypothetical protein